MQRRYVLALLGIGLVLVGLLAGILITLQVSGPEAGVSDEAGRIELGKSPSDGRIGTIDASAPVVNVEAATLNRLFREVSARVTPAVVYIQVETVRERAPRGFYHDFDGEGPEGFRDPGGRSTSVGSGVVISDKGHIVTNNHVVENASAIQVMLADKREFPARVVGVDPSTDLAVIKLENVRNLPVIRFGDSDRLTVGEWVLAVGNPFRLTSTVTQGIVSALGRQVNVIEGSFGIEDFIQTDAAINPGNSGGALVNLRGELVGISTAIATESGSYEGYGFAVPVNLMKRVAEDLISYGEVRRGFLGVSIQEVSSRRAQQLGLDHVGGVYIDEVTGGGAAAKAGLKKGDVVLSINGLPINAPNELQRTIARYRPGDQLKIDVWRQGARRHYSVRLLGREDPNYRSWFTEMNRQDQRNLPPDAGMVPENLELSDWGIGIRDLTTRDRTAFQVENGAYISYVKNGTTGQNAGLPRDAIVLAIGRTVVQSAEEAIRAIERYSEQEKALVFRVRRRDGVVAFYELDVPAEG